MLLRLGDSNARTGMGMLLRVGGSNTGTDMSMLLRVGDGRRRAALPQRAASQVSLTTTRAKSNTEPYMPGPDCTEIVGFCS
eukprot:2809061-Rhodomonas_salina.1